MKDMVKRVFGRSSETKVEICITTDGTFSVKSNIADGHELITLLAFGLADTMRSHKKTDVTNTNIAENARNLVETCLEVLDKAYAAK